uniref:Transposase n=1 Tax=Streptomyces sp. NBC_00003 TaxID=2903608 RepID=A0AAU2UXF0_9ACTN
MHGTTRHHDDEDWPDGARTRRPSARKAVSRLYETRRLSALRRQIRDEVITARAGKRITTDLRRRHRADELAPARRTPCGERGLHRRAALQ